MKKSKLCLCLLMTTMLVGCNKPTNIAPPYDEDESSYVYTPQDMASRDVQLPTTIPTLNEDSIQIHYHRNDNKYKDWGLWLWDPDGADDSEVDVFNYMDDFGVTASYPLSKFGDCSGKRLGFIIRKIADWTKDTGSDRFIDFNSVNKDKNGVYHVYIYSNDSNIYASPNKTFADQILSASFTSDSKISVKCSNSAYEYYLYEDGKIITSGTGLKYKQFSINMPSDHPTADITKTYRIDVVFYASGARLGGIVSVSNLFKSDKFNEGFTYDGELGAIYSKTSTEFKVWSPVSKSIKVRIYDNGTPTEVDSTIGSNQYQEYTMTKGDKGVFSYTATGDLEGKYYTYVVTNSSFIDKEIVDPYAKSAGVNGLRGMIVDFEKTNPTGWDEIVPHPYNRNELTVWETHVSDVTSHESWGGTEANKRKYLGMCEEGTTYTKNDVTVKTGFDHIVELGVNAVQILPIFDQANDELNYAFNWGYNPLNYNVLEGLYSSNPHDGYARIKEFKTLVQKYNEKGINIIMDVVYNHVNGAVNSNFDVLMPGYYYRYNQDGSLSNGSGCGNETASEMPMMRKFIVDSTSFLASEYKLGGFRFDLMGLHDLTTMNKLTAECKKVNENIVIYGEPWTGGTSAMESFDLQSAKQSNANYYKGYGQFNDQMRDALIKGGLNSDTSLGWITNRDTVNQNDVNLIKKGIAGITYNSNGDINDPNKTVNYVTCHDNYTLYDRCYVTLQFAKSEVKKAATLANAVVFTSQGTSFMLGGEEMLRTKNRNSNSYNAPDSVNQYNYNNKITYLDVFKNYQALIEFKQTVTDLHSSTSIVNVEDLDGGSVLKYSLNSDDKQYIVIHSNDVGTKSSIDLSGYKLYLDTLGTIEKDTELGNVTPKKYQTIIAYKAKA